MSDVKCVPESKTARSVAEPELRFPEFSGSWKRTKLGQLLEIRSASRVHKDQWTSAGVPFFRSSDIVAAYKGLENKKAYISNDLFEELSEKSGRVKKNDLLVTGGGSIGIPYLINSDDPLYFKDADLLWLKNSEVLNGFYLYTYFSTQIFRKYLKSISHIGTISHYTIEQAKQTPINFPEIKEQQKIADFLSSVDKKIEQLTEKHRLLTQYKKGIMQQIFTQQIRFKDNNGNDYPEWRQTKFSNLFKFIKTNSLSRADLVNDGEVMNIHYGDIHTRLPSQTRIETTSLPYIAPHIDLSKFEEDTFCRDGDLIVADASEDYLDIGKAIELSAVEHNKVMAGLHTFLARPDKSKIADGFSGYVMQIDSVRKQIMRLATGVSVLGISKTNLGKVILPIPCTEEQQKIANFLTEIDQKINQAWSILEQTKAFKKGLLQKMFV